jgi:hypothetical protein
MSFTPSRRITVDTIVSFYLYTYGKTVPSNQTHALNFQYCPEQREKRWIKAFNKKTTEQAEREKLISSTSNVSLLPDPEKYRIRLEPILKLDLLPNPNVEFNFTRRFAKKWEV